MRAAIKSFAYTRNERLAIIAALRTEKPWKDASVTDIKRKIKDYHLKINSDVCCYCQRDLKGEFQMVIDVEHILPSSLFKRFTFKIWNTSASCKRCNMNIKNDNIDFIDYAQTNKLSKEYYKIAHPNFEDIYSHLEINIIRKGQKRLVKYEIHTNDKGKYTYDYFKLKNIEINSFDDAQGIEQKEIDELIANKVNELSEQHEPRVE